MWKAPVPADFATWTCAAIHDEHEAVQRQAAGIAYGQDESALAGLSALGSGFAVHWPTLVALRPSGMDARDLQRLKARLDALQAAAATPRCAGALPPVAQPLPGWPVLEQDRLVYEDRRGQKPAVEWELRLASREAQGWTLQGDEPRPRVLAASPDAPAVPVAPGAGIGSSLWQGDRAGNLLQGPDGALVWPLLLRPDLGLGQVTAGDMLVTGDPQARARLRGQLVAVGQQPFGDRRFDAALIELFGDAPNGEAYTRVEGVIVIDRRSGLLLRLDLRSAHPAFNLQRRLLRVEPAAPR